MSDANTRVHHPFSPSKLQALEACPKYESHSTDSAASRAGTIQHDAVDGESDSAHMTDNQALAVAECLAYADSIAKKYKGGTVIKENYLPIDNEIIEITETDGTGKLDPNPAANPFPGVETVQWTQPIVTKRFRGTTAGYLDYAVVSTDETEAEIIDWKFGQWAVESTENNLQGIAYMLGLKKRFPKLKRCTIHFVLPHRDELDVHAFDLNDENLMLFHTRIRRVVRAAQDARKDPNNFAAANPNTGACLFCALIGQCPKVTEMVARVSEKFAPLQVPQNVNPTMILDPEDTAIGIQFAAIAKTWAESFRARATEKSITDPDFIPTGYTLETRTKRKVLNARLFADVAKKFVPVSMDAEIEKLFDLPIGGVEEVIELATPRGQKSKAVEAFGKAALEAGAIEMGQPFAFLKMSTTKKPKTKKEKTK
jgi:hypothetical protein